MLHYGKYGAVALCEDKPWNIDKIPLFCHHWLSLSVNVEAKFIDTQQLACRIAVRFLF